MASIGVFSTETALRYMIKLLRFILLKDLTRGEVEIHWSVEINVPNGQKNYNQK